MVGPLEDSTDPCQWLVTGFGCHIDDRHRCTAHGLPVGGQPLRLAHRGRKTDSGPRRRFGRGVPGAPRPERRSTALAEETAEQASSSPAGAAASTGQAPRRVSPWADVARLAASRPPHRVGEAGQWWFNHLPGRCGSVRHSPSKRKWPDSVAWTPAASARRCPSLAPFLLATRLILVATIEVNLIRTDEDSSHGTNRSPQSGQGGGKRQRRGRSDSAAAGGVDGRTRVEGHVTAVHIVGRIRRTPPPAAGPDPAQ